LPRNCIHPASHAPVEDQAAAEIFVRASHRPSRAQDGCCRKHQKSGTAACGDAPAAIAEKLKLPAR
jgi:hypothetical protein